MTRAALLLLLLGTSAPPASSAVCDAIARDAEAASRAGDIEALEALHAKSISCGPLLVSWIGRRTAEQLYNRATANDPPDEAMLLASLGYGRTWQTLATLGELASGRRDHAVAARRYQEALVEIADPNATPTPPAEAVILSIRRRAEQSGLLSPTYVPLARGRDGSNAGLGASSIRGVAVTAVALPVQFRFDSTDLTEAGLAAVNDLVGMLRAERPSPAQISLIGHTDAKGPPDYNLRLSLRRAETVRAYLISQGIKSRITAEGRGESEPYEPDDPGRYDEAELDQMSRRVELRRR